MFIYYGLKQKYITVADPEFHQDGAANHLGGANITFYQMKLKEFGPRGRGRGTRPKILLCRSATPLLGIV